MQNVTFDFSDLHQHGRAFYDFLALRKSFFVDELGWDIPHDDHVEMDQYDTPQARYSVVLLDGIVIGGARTMPTTARWGQCGYMLGDAVAGLLPGIPRTILPEAPCSARIWECTRLVMSHEVRLRQDRARCLELIVDGLAHAAHRGGADRLISLSPLTLERALRQLGWDTKRIGEPYVNSEDGRRYAVLSMSATKTFAQSCVAA
jgi:N-acyl-L-homoserine lactone synthetase